MKDSTIIRLAELACGCFCLAIYALTGVDNALIILCSFLFGVPLEIIYERVRERAEKEKQNNKQKE